MLLCTTNQCLTHEKKLVMGKGAALAFKYAFSGCDKNFGLLISQTKMPYGVLFYALQHDLIIGIFQVKTHWADSATLPLITASVSVLDRLAREHWKDCEVRLNFPGIGNGGLATKDVKPLLLSLPDNVTLWRYSYTVKI